MDQKEAIEELTGTSCSGHCINGEDGCSAYNCKAENCRFRQATIMAVNALKREESKRRKKKWFHF